MKRADGSPTARGFACGDGMLAERNPDGSKSENSVTLFLVRGVFHVQAVDWTRKDIRRPWDWNDSAGFRVWLTFASLKEARRAFYQQCKRLNLTPSHRSYR